MELKIDVEVGDYLSGEDLEEEIKYAVKEYVAREVDEYFEIHSYRDFIGKTASDVFWRSIEEMGEDTRGAIRNAVRKTIVKLQPYQLIGKVYSVATGRIEVTPVQQIINEEVEKLRPEISKPVHRLPDRGGIRMTYVKLTNVRAFPGVQPTKEQDVSPSDGTECTHFERGNRKKRYKGV